MLRRLLLCALLLCAAPVHAATFTVDSTSDTSATDATPGDGLCATAGAVCTLRAAIEEANALAGTDTIAFSIPGAGPHTITLTSALPTITTAIDGFTEPGSSVGDLIAGTPPTWMIRIDADSITNGGLVVDGVTVQGLEVLGVAGNDSSAYCISVYGGGTVSGTLTHDCQGGIVSAGDATITGNVAHSHRLAGITTLGDDVVIRNNVVCLEPDGVTQATQTFGVYLEGGADAIVGGTETAHRNIISGCGTGVELKDAAVTGATIRFNYIGPDVNGSTANGALCNDINDNGTGTTESDNTFCPPPTPTATATATPEVFGCCNITGIEEFVTCLDEPFNAGVTSQAGCQAILDGFELAGTATDYNPDALCGDPGAPMGSCPTVGAAFAPLARTPMALAPLSRTPLALVPQ